MKHSLDMTFYWAKENGIKGYDHLNPQIRKKRQQEALNKGNRDNSNNSKFPVDRKKKKRYK